MSITDELRTWAKEHLSRSSILAIADRIDAEHETTELQKESYRLDLKAANIAVGEAYKRGFDEGFASADDWLGQHESDMAEHGWVRLPKDADGEYIHIGDEMEGVDKYDSLKKVMGKVITVSYEADGIVDVAIQAWSSDGKSWHRAYLDTYASVYHHYQAPTVEDVLREFFARYVTTKPKEEDDAIIAEYAAKLQLAEEDA